MTTKPNDAIPRPRMIEAAQHAANTISDLANAGGSARSVSFALANLVAVALDEQHAAGQGERLGGRSASEFVQERIAEKSRVEGAAEAKPCGHRSTQCTDQEHCVKPEGHAGYCRYEAAPIAEPPSPVAGERNVCVICGASGDFSSCPNCDGDRGLVRYVRLDELWKVKAQLATVEADNKTHRMVLDDIATAAKAPTFSIEQLPAVVDELRQQRDVAREHTRTALDAKGAAESALAEANARAERLEAERDALLKYYGPAPKQAGEPVTEPVPEQAAQPEEPNKST